MSNEFQKPEDKPDGKTYPSSKSRKDGTEDDLWDLDDESTSKAVGKDAGRTAIPSRRKGESSSVESRTPVERHTDEPVPSKKTEEKAKTEETEEDKLADEDKLPEKSVSPVAEDEQPTSETKPEKASPETAPSPKGFLASLTKVEKIGITSLATILVLTALFGIVHFNNRIPLKPLVPEKLDLPIEGKRMTVTSVETYWREPVTEGENRDIVQRGVKLIPVVRIGLENPSGAIRVLFRDEDNTVVGDNISRSIESGGTIAVAGTAGFEDIGMHAAYRTGNSDRWTVQVLEGPEVNAPLEEFNTLLETEVSTNIR